MNESSAIVVEVAHLISGGPKGYGILKSFNNTRQTLKKVLKVRHDDLIAVLPAQRTAVGPLLALGNMTRDHIVSSCIFAAFYLTKYVRVVGGSKNDPENYEDVNVQTLAFLWVTLLDVMNTQPCTEKRYETARSALNRALSAEDKVDLKALVHGSVHAVRQEGELSSSGSGSSDSDSGSGSSDISSSSSSESESGDLEAPDRPPPIAPAARRMPPPPALAFRTGSA